MATATDVKLGMAAHNIFIDTPHPPSQDVDPTIDGLGATEWVELIRDELQNMASGEPLDPKCLSAPRRRHADPESATLAVQIAALLYPAPIDSSIPQVIKYEKDIVALRKAILAQEMAKEEARLQKRYPHLPWKVRIKAQGPWDEVNDPWSLAGAPSLPMPVEISDEESLAPFFAHIGEDRAFDTEAVEAGVEAFYGVGVKEWEKGMLYEDGRMDLCKKVLGPPNIGKLMANLEKNTFVRHFLLGNNVIGPLGAREITDFVRKYPNNIETWYLAGNCIDLAAFQRLVLAWTQSTAVTNIWLKRNPLRPKAYDALQWLTSADSEVIQIRKTTNLRTLDLDQTELSDEGVSRLFTRLSGARIVAEAPPLSSCNHELPLRNIYLNATGISTSACKAIASFLCSPYCKLESLYMSCNPVGDAGAVALAQGLAGNDSLLRLSIASCGLKSTGAEHIMTALKAHPRLMSLNIGQNYTTDDLNARFNWLEDRVVPSVKSLVQESKTLRMLELGTTAMTLSALTDLAEVVAKSETLVVFSAKSLYGKVPLEIKAPVNAQIKDNVERLYGMSVDEFAAGEKRWLTSPKDVRLIDSGYRNRDAGLARRGLLRLKKVWEDDMETVQNVMHADDAQLEA